MIHTIALVGGFIAALDYGGMIVGALWGAWRATLAEYRKG